MSHAGTPPTSQTDLIRLVSADGSLAAYICPAQGGELAGLEVRVAGKSVELLYRGKDYTPTDDWQGKAPVLWPAVGRNFDGVASDATHISTELGWRWKGTRYPMPIHGFARTRAWNVVEQAATRGSQYVELSLRDDAETRRSYPFGFQLNTRYTVADNSIRLWQRVRAAASNSDPMPFSIGNHMTFNVPLVPGGHARDVVLTTPGETRLLLDSAGRPTGRSERVSFERGVPLGDLTPRDALSLTGYPQDAIWAELEDPKGISIRIVNKPARPPVGDAFVLFNLWGDISAGFFSPEPWVGRQNSLATLEGVTWLSPGEVYDWTVEIVVKRSQSIDIDVNDAEDSQGGNQL